ncbi:polar amino acid transport system ATP-binding protein [Pilibacter termitis]|uniref:Polar amino acid transport system ATP-binding protein n=1 Tax=Pilibacter termitis TaxID=263852 RepID=A0A1T4KLV4_9ENTE|nr:ATP-binding cassette domain-containing protein [Pilibacter termitis]SJZ43368.1 polar amino acid transport system ATP-binding protein [Pilibacter termitis]
MLEIKNLTKKFGERLIIDHLNLKIDDGDILTVVGESGGGKTTLLRILAGLETKTSGEILLDGNEIHPEVLDTKEQVMGVVFQDFQLFPHLSVLENITLAPINVLKITRENANTEAMGLLEQLGLSGKERLYPYQLSGGQKQRVALARALAMKPKILGYDEPTSALDPELRRQVEEMILELKTTGVTQIVVTHDLEFAEKISDKMLKVEALKE